MPNAADRPRKEEKARVGTKVMHDGTGDDLAEEAPIPTAVLIAQGEIEAARTLREVGDHETETTPIFPPHHPGSGSAISAPVMWVSV